MARPDDSNQHGSRQQAQSLLPNSIDHRLAKPTVAHREPMSAKERVNILLVDDQPGKLLTYEAMLHELDENLIKASSGKEALSVLLKNEVAVVLLDVSMPEIDGFELAQMIRQHPRFDKTAIIFVSAVNLTDLDRLKGYILGAADYISVPVVPQLLRSKVSVFVDLHRKAKQAEELNAQLRQMSSRLLTLQDDERRRVARELHDGLVQDLAAAKLIFARIVEDSASSHHLLSPASPFAGRGGLGLGAANVSRWSKQTQRD